MNNIIWAYVENITQEVNNPNSTIDIFERFFYNLVIFFYWMIIQMKFIMLKLTEIICTKYKLIQMKIYESIFGNKKFRLSTPNLFYSVLKDIPNNSHILDFGCGSGICYKNKDTVDLIIKRNHKITGIDINLFAIENFMKNVKTSLLTGKINLKCENIFKAKFEKKFDYVIFSESAPLLENDVFTEVVSYIKYNLLNSTGKIIFINNLVENPQFFVSFIKPKLKYITTLDFGRILTLNEFQNLATEVQMKINIEILDSMTVEEIAMSHNIGFIYKIASKFGFKNYDVKQYKITME